MKGYLSVRETSYKWNVAERRVNQYVTEGRYSRSRTFRAILGNPRKRKEARRPEKRKEVND